MKNCAIWQQWWRRADGADQARRHHARARQLNPSDRRSSLLVLTDDGLQLVGAAQGTFTERLAELISDVLKASPVTVAAQALSQPAELTYRQPQPSSRSRRRRWGWSPGGAARASGTLPDPADKTGHELDLVVFGRNGNGPESVLAIGEAKSSDTVGRGHLRRLEQLRDLLVTRDERAADGLKLLLFSGSGFSPALTEQTPDRDDVELIDLDRL